MHKFLFFPHVPYHVTTFISVINELNSCDVSIVYADHLKHYGTKKIKEYRINLRQLRTEFFKILQLLDLLFSRYANRHKQ